MIPLPRLDAFDADLDLASPNHGSRNVEAIRMIVIHATADNGSERGAESWMRNPKAQASAHLHIRRDGTIVRLVDDRRRAWHAGKSSWPGVSDVNSASLGWEIANRNDGQEPYSDEQYEAVAHLLRHYLPQGIARPDVVGHFQIAPGRKTDPRGWDWGRMWRMVDLVTEPEEPDVELVDSIERPPQPNLEKVHPLRRPVTEVAREGETMEAFLARIGSTLPKPLDGVWDLLLSVVRKRLEREGEKLLDEVLDRVLGS